LSSDSGFCYNRGVKLLTGEYKEQRMNKKVTKWIIMLLCMIFIWTGNMTTYAAETADPETSDLKPLELYQIDESYGDLDEAAMSISDSSSGTALSYELGLIWR
jgi:hypothetical protein